MLRIHGEVTSLSSILHTLNFWWKGQFVFSFSEYEGTIKGHVSLFQCLSLVQTFLFPPAGAITAFQKLYLWLSGLFFSLSMRMLVSFFPFFPLNIFIDCFHQIGVFIVKTTYMSVSIGVLLSFQKVTNGTGAGLDEADEVIIYLDICYADLFSLMICTYIDHDITV